MLERIGNLIRGFLSLFISGLERENPEALLAGETEHLREQVARYNQGLASHAGLCERLMAQVRKLESEERDFKAKTTANLNAGNREVAGQYAVRLQTVTSELAENRKQLEQGEETYKNLLKARDVAISAARAKIEHLRASLDDLKVKRAMAELTEMAGGMISSIGGSGDTLDRVSEMVEQERAKAAGRARVAKDSLPTTEIAMKESEQKALADQALADFAAREGLPFERADPDRRSAASAEPAKTMGPDAQTQ